MSTKSNLNEHWSRLLVIDVMLSQNSPKKNHEFIIYLQLRQGFIKICQSKRHITKPENEWNMNMNGFRRNIRFIIRELADKFAVGVESGAGCNNNTAKKKINRGGAVTRATIHVTATGWLPLKGWSETKIKMLIKMPAIQGDYRTVLPITLFPRPLFASMPDYLLWHSKSFVDVAIREQKDFINTAYCLVQCLDVVGLRIFSEIPFETVIT